MKKLQAFMVCLLIFSSPCRSFYALSGVEASSFFKQSKPHESALYNLLLNLEHIATQDGYHELSSDVKRSLFLLDYLHKTIPYNSQKAFDEVKESYHNVVTFFDKRSLITLQDVMKFGQLCKITHQNLKKKNFVFSTYEQQWMSNFESLLTLMTSRITRTSSLGIWRKAYKKFLVWDNSIWHKHKGKILAGAGALIAGIVLYYAAHQKNPLISDAQKKDKKSLGNRLPGDNQDELTKKSPSQFSLSDAQSKKAYGSVYNAAFDGDDEAIKDLISRGVNLTKMPHLDWTALMAAAYKGNASTVKLLLPYFVKARLVNAQDRNGETALSWAVMKGDDETVQALLDAGSLNVQNGIVDTARKWASIGVAAIKFDAKRIEAHLGAGGADVRITNKQGDTVLVSAVRSGKSSTVKLLIPYFVEAGMLNAQNENGSTALMWAAIRGNNEIVQALIAAGADVRITNKQGDTALMSAARSGKSSTVKLLIPYFAKAGMLNTQNENGSTALMYAAVNGDDTTVQALLNAGADVTIIGGDGVTALMCAGYKGKSSLVKLLIPYFAKAGMLNAQDINGTTTLTYATGYCDDATVQALIAAGADVRITNKYGGTALMCAAYKGKSSIVQQLIPYFVEAGMLNAQDAGGNAALMWAIWNGDGTIVQALLNAGADVTKINNQGKTALDLARESKRDNCVKILAAAGAK